MGKQQRAVIFDLDDTLYGWRTFQLSGFRAVADRLERDHRLPGDAVFRLLWHASAHGHTGRELQVLCERFSLPLKVVPSLVDIIRGHAPDIKLPSQSQQVLRALRPSWRLGVLTNGRPDIQARKVKALGLATFVDAIVYADEYSDGGKPRPEGFLEILRRLNVEASSAAFVGDNDKTDIAGAAAVGIAAIHLVAGPRFPSITLPETGGTRITSLREVPAVVERLIQMPRVARVA